MSDDTLYEYLTVGENIKFYKNLFSEKSSYDERVKEYIRLFDIEQYYNILVKNLSQGTRNKLYIAIMLSKDFKALVLDEPFTALDKGTQETIMSKIQFEAISNNKSVIMVTHIEEFKKIATRRITIHKHAS
jgi:ABC-type multidrug transport system ATPase subunit